MEEQGQMFVRKFGNIDRNLERYKSLENIVNVPKILKIDSDHYDMEYIFGIDMKKYLLTYSVEKLEKFIFQLLEVLSKNSITHDYTQTYLNKLQHFEFDDYRLDFDSQMLLEVLPKHLPQSQYIGDLSLDNIIYSIKDDDFVLIDPLTTVYDSYVFDIAKLRQDLCCKWFIRTNTNQLESPLEILSTNFKCHNSLVILMLMRVLPYSKTEWDRNFLINEINKLWNSI